METTRTRSVTGKVAALAAVAAAGLLVAACGSSSPSSTSAPAAPASASASATAGSATATIKTASTSLGTVLVNGQGMTLYWFAADHGNTSACSGACAAAWPPVIGTPTAGTGVTGTLATITRSDGTKQVTWNGHPLYTYAGDTASGQVNGNKLSQFGALWYAVTTSAGSGTGGGASTAPTSSSKSGWS